MRTSNAMKKAMLGMGIAALMTGGMQDVYYADEKPRKIDPYSKPTPPVKPGVKQFKFDDGFTCTAINQRNADRKHANWLKSQNS